EAEPYRSRDGCSLDPIAPSEEVQQSQVHGKLSQAVFRGPVRTSDGLDQNAWDKCERIEKNTNGDDLKHNVTVDSKVRSQPPSHAVASEDENGESRRPKGGEQHLCARFE